MQIDGNQYVEIKALASLSRSVCDQCAFATDAKICAKAIAISPLSFGGDCEDRDVIYEEVPNA